jgi:hypothetical protein
MNFLPPKGRIFKRLFSRSKILSQNQRSSALPSLIFKGGLQRYAAFCFLQIF